jgi:tetratricopeptide (TPR) repeat protein
VFVFVLSDLWHNQRMMIRYALAITLTLTSGTIAFGQAAQDTTVVGAPPAAETIDPAKKQAQEIDRLFGELHKQNAFNPNATIAKIWALWSRNDSAMAEVLFTQSGKAMQDGVFDTSETMLNELIGSYPDYVEALNKRAMLYYNMKRYDEALVDLNSVLDNEPRHFGALSGMAAVYQAQGNVAKAAGYLRDAIAINPHLETAKQVLKQLEHDYPTL